MVIKCWRYIITVAAFAFLYNAVPANSGYADDKLLRIESINGKVIASYSLQQLKTDFPNNTYNTSTPWTKDGETISYRGPNLKSVLARSGMVGNSSIQIIAYDNFITEIEMDEITKYSPILALEQGCSEQDVRKSVCTSGQEFRPISINEFGPVYIVWPYDKLPHEYVPMRNNIWVWFVVAIRPISW